MTGGMKDSRFLLHLFHSAKKEGAAATNAPESDHELKLDDEHQS